MKRHYFLLLLFPAFSLNILAQQKTEFGFILRGGNFGLPYHKQESYEYFTATDKHDAGAAYALGIWWATPVAKQLRISWELLYQSSFSTRTKRYQNLLPPDPNQLLLVVNNSLHTQRVAASSIHFPMKLEMQFRENGKWSLFMGGGLSRILSWTSNETLITSSTGLPDTKAHYRTRDRSGLRNWQTNLTAGVYYRFSPQTILGAEYIFGTARANFRQLYPEVFCGCLCDCDNVAYYNSPGKHMSSFSLSLRHNLLNKDQP